MSCDPCTPCVLSCDLPECGETLNLGVDLDPYNGTEYTAYVQYFVGGDEVILKQDITLSYSGDEIVLDLTNPSKEHYNSFNGQYKIWVTVFGQPITERITMVKDAIEALIWAVKFKKVTGNELVDLEIIPVDTTCD